MSIWHFIGPSWTKEIEGEWRLIENGKALQWIHGSSAIVRASQIALLASNLAPRGEFELVMVLDGKEYTTIAWAAPLLGGKTLLKYKDLGSGSLCRIAIRAGCIAHPADIIAPRIPQQRHTLFYVVQAPLEEGAIPDILPAVALFSRGPEWSKYLTRIDIHKPDAFRAGRPDLQVDRVSFFAPDGQHERSCVDSWNYHRTRDIPLTTHIAKHVRIKIDFP